MTNSFYDGPSMPMFGQHETGQRLHTSGVGAIYVLKSDEKKIVKVLQPPPGIWSDDQLREEIDGFLLRSKTQRVIAKSSQSWAAVYETSAIREGTEGSAGEGGEAASRAESPEYRSSGAYALLDRYDRSVASLIDGRVNLNNDDLRNVISGVIKGLIDIRAVASRPHGNLKPANILLSDSADLAKAKIHLTDPAADGALSPNSHNKDLADLAKIIYELVNLQPYTGGTIGQTKDWKELGPNGDDWRKLCSTLLDTSAPAEDRDLAKILAKIDTWRAKPKKSKLPLVIAAVFILLIGGGIAAWIFTRPPKIDFDQPRWEKLCFTYQSWMDDFLGRMDDSTKQKYSQAPYPTEIIALLNKAGSDLDKYNPQKIGRRLISFKELAINPSDDAKTGYGPYYTKQGDELADNITQALTPAKWPLLTQLDTTAKTYEQRGWLKPASGIRSLIDSAKPPELPTTPPEVDARAKLIPQVDMFANIDSTIKASMIVTTIEAKWNRIETEIKQLPDTNVPLLKSFQKFAEDVPRSALEPGKKGTLDDVQALSASFTSIDNVAKQLVTNLNSKDHEIVYDELAKDPAVQLPPDGKLTIEMYENLPTIAQGYFKMKTDPRAALDWSKSLDDVQNGIINVIADANKQDKNLPTLINDHDAVQKEVATFAAISPIEKNRSEIEVMVAKARDDLSLLQRNGNTWVNPYRTDPVAYVADKQAGLATSPVAKTTPVVYEQWKKAYTALLDKVSRNKDQLKKDYHYKIAIDDKFKKLESIYLGIDAAIPAQVPGLAQITAAGWPHTIAARVSTIYREKTLTNLMTNSSLKWSDDLPQIDDPAYQSYAREQLTNFDQNRKDALSLITDFSGIQDRLDHLELLPNEPAKNAPTWRDLFTKWQSNHSPLLADSEITTAIKPITDRVTSLLQLDAISDYKPLLDKSVSASPEISLTAWRKIGDAKISQDIPLLDDENKSEDHLITQINSLGKQKILDPSQLAAFSKEIQSQRPLRWHRWADVLSSPSAIQTALDHKTDFGVTLDPRADSQMIFNDALYSLRKASDKNPKEAELKTIVQNFINAVSAMPPQVSKDAKIQDLLARLAKPLSQSQEESSAAGAGPKLAGWEQDNSKEGMRIFYFPNKASPRYTLKFVRLQVAQKTIFLCTTEMSVGIFADTVNGSGKFADLDNAGKTADNAHWFKTTGDDLWGDQGPRSWKIFQSKILLNTRWLSEDAAQMVQNNIPYYPAKTAPPLPSANSPMQLLSPWSAMYVAHLLGCRLPTSDEWKAAYDKYDAGGPKDAWNLRGSAWQTQQDYSKQMSSKGMTFPDQGIFLTPDLMFSDPPVTADSAKPWHGDDIAKLAPNRVTPGPAIYPGSKIWFRDVGTQPGATSDDMQDLVGNVAEYVFDAPGANAVLKDNSPTVDAVNKTLAAGNKSLFVIGGSSLSPPQIPFNKEQPLDPDFAQSASGFCDVGFRLAYTAPIDSIVDVLAAVYKEPPYFPGPHAPAH